MVYRSLWKIDLTRHDTTAETARLICTTRLWLAERKSFALFCIYGVLLRWFIKAKPYFITKIAKGLKLCKSKILYCKETWPWKKISLVNFRKLHTTSTIGLVVSLNMLFHDVFTIRCNRLYTFLSKL